MNKINQLKDQALNQINQDRTNDQVDVTTNQMTTSIDNVQADVVAKPKAIADIEKAFKEKQQQIDSSVDSTDNEKKLLHKHLQGKRESTRCN